MTITKQRHFGIQRKIVANMTTESWKNIPHVTYMYEPDVTKFCETLKILNSDGSHKNKITLNTVMLKAITEGIKNAPWLNAHIDFNDKLVSGTISEIKEIDISMPWLLQNGEMITINMQDMGSKTLDEMADYISATAKRIENSDMNEAMFEVSLDNTMSALKRFEIPKVIGRLIGAGFGRSKVSLLKGKERREYYKIPHHERITKHDIKQGTITVTNIGSIYREQKGGASMLEIIPPQIFAVGIGAVQKKPLVITDKYGNDTIQIRQVMPVCLAFDHRALDFGDLVPFLKRMDDIFENAEQILNW